MNIGQPDRYDFVRLERNKFVVAIFLKRARKYIFLFLRVSISVFFRLLVFARAGPSAGSTAARRPGYIGGEHLIKFSQFLEFFESNIDFHNSLLFNSASCGISRSRTEADARTKADADGRRQLDEQMITKRRPTL